jgi:hypothetical protein
MRGVISAMTVVAALAVVAGPMVAQQGPGARERPGFMGRGMMAAGPLARVQNPGALLLERRAELGLAEDQVRQIEGILARVERENAPRIEQLRAAFGDRKVREMTVDERQQMRERMQQLQPVRQQVRETNRAAGQEIHALLTVEQQQKLRELRRERMAELRKGRGEARDGEWQRRRGDRRGPRGGGR